MQDKSGRKNGAIDFNERPETSARKQVISLHREQERYARERARICVKLLRDTQMRQKAEIPKVLESLARKVKIVSDHVPLFVQIVQATINKDWERKQK